MREPHWLAGTTSLKVTGGLLVAGLLLIELIMSLKQQNSIHFADKIQSKTFNYFKNENLVHAL